MRCARLLPAQPDRPGNVIIKGAIRSRRRGSLGLRASPVSAWASSQPEQRLLRIALNRLQEKGDWSLDELKIEFEELILEQAPVEICGFREPEIDQILLGEDVDGAGKGSAESAPTCPADRALGDVFVLGDHRSSVATRPARSPGAGSWRARVRRG